MTPVLELVDVTFRRDGKQIIDGISLTVHEGEHWALLGPNGAHPVEVRYDDGRWIARTKATRIDV